MHWYLYLFITYGGLDSQLVTLHNDCAPLFFILCTSIYFKSDIIVLKGVGEGLDLCQLMFAVTGPNK